MARQLVFDIIANNQASGAIKGLGDDIQAQNKKIEGMKAAAGVAIGAAVAAGVAFATESVNAFSALEDATAAASVIFGDSMSTIIAQSKSAGDTLGMTQSQVIAAANTFGTYGKAAGLSGDALAKFSTDMTSLAGDMASFKGTSAEQAIEAIGAAMRGETEPIRAYGVLLDDATLRNRALAMGLISTTKDALTPQQKALAAQAEILAQTADAQGDFARTADSTANTQKRMEVAFNDVQIALGEKLAPAFTTVKGYLAEFFDAAQVGIEWLSANTWVIAGVAAVILTALAPAIWGAVVATWGFTAALLANPITWVALGIGILVAAIVLLWQNWDQVAAWFQASWQGFQEAFNGLCAFMGEVWNQMWAGIGAALSAAWTGITTALSAAWRSITGALDTAVAGLKSAWDGVVSWVSGLGSRISTAASGMWNGIGAAFRGAINGIIRGWNSLSFTIPGGEFLGATWAPYHFGVPQIPYLATGGVAYEPTLAMIGEAGREAVLPFDRADEFAAMIAAAGGAGGQVIHIHIAGSVVTEADLVTKVRDGIAQGMRRRGLNPAIIGV